ncbi:MAG TPA: NAD-dependent malic enzyme, partial [Pedococcus sp.]
MAAIPSVSNSITVRLILPARATAVSELTGVIEKNGGLVTGLDVTASGHDRLRVDVTVAARDTGHADEIVEAMRSVHGVEIGKVSDRTFL